MSKSTPIVLSTNDWNTSNIRYMQPKVNDRGGKSINIISTQTNRSLHISTPLMMTWGIADFVDEKGESDGKFSMSLNFPMEDYATPATTDFLNKLKEFETQILNDAVKNSESWFGEEMSLAVAKHTFFPFLKYSKDKQTKKFDYTKPPSIRAKVPNYDNRWGLEIYDTKGSMIFPCDNDNLTPMDFVPKKSSVACVLQCGGIWFGGKGWGITWKVNQIVVKPVEIQSVFGKCHIQLSNDDMQTIEKQDVTTNITEEDDDGGVTTTPTITQPVVLTNVADSDDEDETKTTKPPVKTVEKPLEVEKEIITEKEPVVEEESVAEVAPVVVKKKIIKKKVV